MLGDNIKTFRKKKGFSQETLAQELFVVRQTVSKWEKGQSVPDAEMIEKLAEALDVSVNDLLGKESERKENEERQDNEIANQLAILNNQLAGINRRRKKQLRVLLTIIIAATILPLVTTVICGALLKNVTSTGITTVTETIYCTIDGNDYVWEVTYDKEGNLIEANGDDWIKDNIKPQKHNTAEGQFKEIEEYVEAHNGSYTYY